MRPVTVMVPLPPSYRGGTEEYAYRVVERLSRKIPVRLITTRVRWGHDEHPLSIGNAELVVVPASEIMERPIVFSSSARSSLRSAVENSSLVHLHMPFPLVERWATTWAKKAGIPSVLTYHMDANLARWGVGWLARGFYRGYSARPALTHATTVISNSLGYAKASAVLSGYLGKVQVIAKGVDPDRLGFGKGRPSNLASIPGVGPVDPSRRRIVFVGRLVSYKGLPVLIDAVNRLVQEGTSVHLFIAGRGPEESRLKARVKQVGLEDRVTFLGFVPDEHVGDLYRWADVVACPSLNMLESTPTTLEEAASLGTPVVGSDLPGASESIPSDGIHGLLVPPGDPRALALGIRKLLQVEHWSPPRARTWDDVAGAYLRVFAQLVPAIPT
ncbi:MAG: glycosyltransferase family 4 protein [Thermoplasmata archaeon]